MRKREQDRLRSALAASRRLHKLADNMLRRSTLPRGTTRDQLTRARTFLARQNRKLGRDLRKAGVR